MNLPISNILDLIFVRKIKYLVVISSIFLLIILAICFVFFNGGSYTSFNLNNPFSRNNFIGMISSIVCGFGLAGVGCAAQSINRNNLAGPSTLGYLPAATLGIVIWSILNNLEQTWSLYLICFFISSIVLFFNVLFLNLKNSLKSEYKVVLIGITIGAILSAISVWLAQSNSSIGIVVNSWIGGGGINFDSIRISISAPLIIISLIVIYLNSTKLNIIQKNIVLAAAAGIKIKKLYFIIGFASIIIVTSVVVLFGSVLFIGIVIPHLTRLMMKSKDNWIIIPSSGLLSSILLISSLFLVSSFSLGINFLIAIISAPIFINLLRRGKI